MAYDRKFFRSVKHGTSDTSADCRHCSWSEFEGGVATKAKSHARKNLHTVDVYRESHTEYTSYYKKDEPLLASEEKV